MHRTRIAAVGFGVVALGVAAVLVPSVSSAEQSAVAAPVGTVRWVDRPAAVTTLPDGTLRGLGDRWYGAFFGARNGDGTVPIRPLTDAATFEPAGLTLDGAAPAVLVHGFATPVQPSALPDAFDGAAVDATGRTNFAVLVQYPGQDPIAAFPSSAATSGVDGAATTWGPDGAAVDTAHFAAQLEQNHATIVGYAEYLGLAIEGSASADSTARSLDAASAPGAGDTATTSATGTPTGAATAPAVGTAAPAASTRAAATPAPQAAAVATTLRSITFDHVTTEFTPRPTARVTVPSTTLTRTAATTTGTAVSGSGFVPGETVRVAVAQGDRADEVADTTFVADADGAVSGRVVLPASFVTGAGTYSLVLVGVASAQTASVALTVTGDPAVPAAVPATPVRTTATFTG